MKNFFYNENEAAKAGAVKRSSTWQGLTKSLSRHCGAALLVAGFTAFMAPTSALAQGFTLEQIRNGGSTAGSQTDPATWVTGAANHVNAHYTEGQSIATRLTVTGLSAGAHTIEIEYDIRNSGKAAIDYLTHYNNISHGGFDHNAETINPLSGVTVSNPGFTEYDIPAPTVNTDVTINAITKSQPISSFNALMTGNSGLRKMTLFGGTIEKPGGGLAIEYVSQGSLTAASAINRIKIYFSVPTNNATVVFAWGGHIASRLDWGIINGVPQSAGGISGASYHQNVAALDGVSGVGQRDIQLMASAVLIPPTCDANGPAEICLGDGNQQYTSATDATSASYVWRVVNNSTGAVIVGDSTLDQVVVNPGTTAGSYEVQVRITKNNFTSICSQVTVVNGLPAIALGNDVTLNCTNPSATVCASGLASGVDYDFSWTGPNQFAATDSCVMFEKGDAGVYIVTVTNTETGCVNADTIEIFEDFTKPTVSASNNGPLTCDKTSVTLTGVTNGASYRWEDRDQNVLSNNLTVAVSDTGTYYFIAFGANGCSDTASTVVMENRNAPELDLGADKTLTCTVTSAEVCPGGLMAGIDYGFSWTGPGNFVSSDSCLTFDATFVAGTYTLQVTNLSNGCSDSDQIELIKNTDAPMLDLGADATIACGEDRIQICPGGLVSGIDYSFSWTGPNFMSSDSCITVAEAGTYSLMVTNLANGCTDTDEIEVSLDVCETDMHCTLTQGGWGNKNGRFCNGPRRLELVNALLASQTLTIGGTNRYIKFNATEGACLIDKLPAGGTAMALPAGTQYNSCGSIPITPGKGKNSGSDLLKNGKFNNVLIGQVVALSLNMRLDATKGGNLGSVALTNTMTTYGATSCDSEIAEPILTDVVTRTIPMSVLNYLAVDDVASLLDLANKALNGDTSLPSYADINQAVSAINELFDNCRMMVEAEEVISLAKGTTSLTADKLMQAYPNPFAEKATIEVTFAEAQDYTIEVYDVKGSLVAKVAQGTAEAGKVYTFEIDGATLPEGLYFARLVTKNHVETIKLLLRR